MKIDLRTRMNVSRGLAAVLLVLVGGYWSALGAQSITDWSYRELAAAPEGSTPPLPDPADLPLQLVADDGSVEGAFGVAGAAARQFLWFQSFAPPPNFDLEEIWVLFPQDPQIAPGAAVQLVVYQDPDGDPSNGADLLASFDETVLVNDDVAFSVYSLATPVEFRGGGTVYLGVVSRYVSSGVTPPTQPAAIDVTTPSSHAWVATWVGDPPNPPELPSDQALFRLENLVAGTWMIRGFGSAPNPLDIPTLDWAMLLALGVLLGVGGVLGVRTRRRRSQ